MTYPDWIRKLSPADRNVTLYAFGLCIDGRLTVDEMASLILSYRATLEPRPRKPSRTEGRT
jgi:hypothetical protein